MATVTNKECNIKIGGLTFHSDRELDAYLYEHRDSLKKAHVSGKFDKTYSLPTLSEAGYDKVMTASEESKQANEGKKKYVRVTEAYKYGGAVAVKGTAPFSTPFINYKDIKKDTKESIAKERNLEKDDPMVDKIIENQEKQDNMLDAELSMNIGTDVHAMLEYLCNEINERDIKDLKIPDRFLHGTFLRKALSDSLTEEEKDTLITNIFETTKGRVLALKALHGPGCKFATEVTLFAKQVHPDFLSAIAANKGVSDDYDTVRGTIDLIVIGEDGKYYPYDWKTSRNKIGLSTISTKLSEQDKQKSPSTRWSALKRRSIVAQTAAYTAMWAQYGIKLQDYKIENFLFTFDENNRVTGFSFDASANVYDDFFSTVKVHFPPHNTTTLAAMQEVDQEIATIIPDIGDTVQRKFSEDDITSYINKIVDNPKKVIPTRPSEESKGAFKFYRSSLVGGGTIYADSKEEMKSKLRQYYQDVNIKSATLNTELAEKIVEYSASRDSDAFMEWLTSIARPENNLYFQLRKYVKMGWTLDDSPELIANGFFVFSLGNRSELVLISSLPAHMKVSLHTDVDDNSKELTYKNKRNTILGYKLRDDEYGVDSRFVLPAEVGRILEMKAMSFISKNQDRFKAKPICQIKVLSFTSQDVVNDELWRLQLNWDTLKRLYKKNIDLTSINPACFMDDGEAAVYVADDAICCERESLFSSHEHLLESLHDSQELLKIIESIKRYINVRNLHVKKDDTYAYAIDRLLRAYNYLYGRDINIGVAEPDKGSVFAQPGSILPNGTRMASFDISLSANARTIGHIVDQYRRAIALDLNDLAFEWRKHMKAMQDERGESSTGGEHNWFQDWFVDDPTLMRLKNPYTDPYFQTRPAEKAAAIFFIEEINKYRNEKLFSDPDEKFDVPLFRSHGWEALSTLKFDYIKEKFSRIMDPLWEEWGGLDAAYRESVESHNELTGRVNPIANVNQDERQKILSSKGQEYYTKNIDILFLHAAEWNLKAKHGEHFIPIINGMRLFLATENQINNAKMDEIERSIDDYVRSVVFGENLMSNSERAAYGLFAAIASITSIATLGFKSRQLATEAITGWINLAKVSIASKGDKNTQTIMAGIDWNLYTEAMAENLTNSLHAGYLDSKSQQLSAAYAVFGFGLNGMADTFKYNRYGVKNLDKDIAYWTSSAGDYFNRNALLIMRLKKVGAYDAYDLDENGKLKYDMSKDERYKIYAKYREDASLVPASEIKEYSRQKQAYHDAMDTWIALGSEFAELKYGDDLPHALDLDEQKTLGTQADILYGNFDSQTKNLLSKTFLGSLFMQFKTYGYAKLLTYIKQGGAVNIFAKEYYREINPKTGKLERKVKIINSPEVQADTGQYYTEKFESEVTEEEWRSGNAVYIKDYAGSFMQGKLQETMGLLVALKNLDSEELHRIWNDPNARFNFINALWETIIMTLLAALITRAYGEDTVTNLTNQQWLTRWSYNMVTGIATDGPIWYTFESMFSQGTLPMISILKRYADNAIALLTGNSNIMFALTNTFGATQELSAYFKQ